MTARLPVTKPVAVAVNERSLWVGSRTAVPGVPDQLVQFDRRTESEARRIAVPLGVKALTLTDRELWISHRRGERLSRLDLGSGAISLFQRELGGGKVHAERLIQRPQRRLDGVDADGELVGDALIARGHRVARVLQRTAESEEHASLSGRHVGAGHRTAAAHRGRGHRAVGWGPEHEHSRSDEDGVSVAQTATSAHSGSIDVGAVVRQPVVDEHPVGAHALELGVNARDLLVPRKRDVVVVAPADGETRPGFAEVEYRLVIGRVPVDEKRRTAPFGGDSVGYLARRGDVRIRR